MSRKTRRQKLSSQEKKIWFRKIFIFLRVNGIPFRMGWRPQLQVLEELAGYVSSKSEIHHRAIETYYACLDRRPDLLVPNERMGWASVSGGTKRQKEDRSLQMKRFYLSYEWRKLRYLTLKKYGRRCMACGETKGKMHVDHIKPVRKYWELRLDPTNLQVLCEVCNHGKGSWDETDHRPPQRPRISRPRLRLVEK